MGACHTLTGPAARQLLRCPAQEMWFVPTSRPDSGGSGARGPRRHRARALALADLHTSRSPYSKHCSLDVYKMRIGVPSPLPHRKPPSASSNSWTERSCSPADCDHAVNSCQAYTTADTTGTSSSSIIDSSTVNWSGKRHYIMHHASCVMRHDTGRTKVGVWRQMRPLCKSCCQ